MKRKSVNPKIGQDQIAKELGYSSSTLQRYRNDIKEHRPYKLNFRDVNYSRRLRDPKGTQKSSNDDFKRLQMTSERPVIADSTYQAQSIKTYYI